VLEDRTLLSGTPQLVSDINPGPLSSNPSQMVVMGSATYFSANDGVHGTELWKTAGTAAGTTMVADINPGSASSSPGSLTNVNGTLFFVANDGTHGTQLWKSDGTAAGTTMVTAINPTGFSPNNLTNVNGTLFFSANDGTHGTQLWKSDGTAAGTTMVTAINPSGGSNPADLTNVNGTLYFSADGGQQGYQLWKSDGTAAGTTMVKEIYLSAVGAGSFPSNLTNVNGTLFFSAYDGPNGYQLWKSDGTAAGTVSLTGWVDPADLTNVNGELYFSANDGTHGPQLWKSDGTAAGSTMVTDINPTGSFDPANLTNVNGTLFFSANDGTHGTELWKSDGTVAGTTMVQDICPPTTRTASYTYTGSAPWTNTYVIDSSYPSGLTNVNGMLYFSANDGTHGTQLWKSDGTVAGTTMVQDIYPGSSWHTSTYGPGYYSGGTETKTVYLPNSSSPSALTNVNGRLLFAANDGTHGNELWMVPGSPSLSVSAVTNTPTVGQADTFAITALNADGTPDTSLNDTVTITSSDPKATCPSSVNLTNGTAQFSVTFLTAGPQTITATDTQTPSDTGSESDIVVQPASPGSFTLTSFPSSVTAGTAGTFTVTAKNADGSTDTNYTGTVHFTSSDPQAVLPADYTFTAANAGVHTFSGTLKTAGTQSISATDTATASDSGTDSGIKVNPAAASTLIIGGFPSYTTAGVAGNLTVTLKDAYGNIATGYTGTVHFTSTDAQASLPANYAFTSGDAGVHTFRATLKTAGTQSITATDTTTASLTGTDGGITLNPAAASQFIIRAPSGVTHGVAFNLTVMVEDAYGNVITGYTGTIHFSSTDSTATLPADYTFTTADKGVHTFTGLILRKKGNQKITITDTLNSALTASVSENVG
jgi:ELWxxDGT repeat protein